MANPSNGSFSSGFPYIVVPYLKILLFPEPKAPKVSTQPFAPSSSLVRISLVMNLTNWGSSLGMKTLLKLKKYLSLN
jgi:hypothetical protein